MSDVTGRFEIDGLVAQRKELDAMLSGNPQMEKRLQKVIRQVLITARRTVADRVKSELKNDPRKAYKAVKTSVYRQVLGGNLSILNKRRGTFAAYEPSHTIREGQRGGNRRPRSEKTNKRMHYDGASRAFVLRFLNAGTNGRSVRFVYDPHRPKVKRGSQGGDVEKYGKTTNTGYRGSIAPRNFFADSSHRAMQQAAAQLSQIIDDMIRKEFAK